MKLYEYWLTRSIRCRWLLEELDVAFESIEINLSKDEHQSENFLKINPMAKVPVLVDGDLTLSESAAICTYLGDKYFEKGFIPQFQTAERAHHNQWMYYCMSELEQPLWTIAKHTFIYDEQDRLAPAKDLAKKDFLRVASVLDTHLGDKAYVLGEKFQVVDVLIGQTLIWAFGMKMTSSYNLLDPFPNLLKYLKRIVERPKMPTALKKLVLDEFEKRLAISGRTKRTIE